MRKRAHSDLHELRAKRNGFEQMAENRALTGDEKRELASVKSDLDEARTRFEDLEIRAQQQRETEAAISPELRNIMPSDHGPDTGGPASVTPFDSRSQLLDVARGRSQGFTLERRSLQLYRPSHGAETMDTRILRQFYEVLDRSSQLFAAAGKVSTGLDQSPINLPVLVDHGEGDQELAESADITVADGATGEVPFFAHRYTGIQSASNSLLNSSAVDMQLMIARMLAQRLVKTWRARLTVGTGTNQPQGITVGAGVGLTAAAADLLEPDELIGLVHTVSPENRDTRRSAFVMHDTTWQHIRTLKDSDGRYLVGDLGMGADMRISGYPVIVDNSMPIMATGNRAVVFGAIEDAFLVRHTDVRVEMSDSWRFQQDEISWRAVIALDSKVVDDTAIKALTMG